MYEPDTRTAKPKYPMFRYVNGHVLPGFGAREIVTTLIIAALGVVLFLAIGAIHKTVVVPTTASEQTKQADALTKERNVLYSDAQADLEKAGKQIAYTDEETGAKLVYSAEEDAQVLRDQAETDGISADTTDAEIDDMVAREKSVQEEVFPAFGRLIVFIIVPLALYIGLCIEVKQATSLRSEVERFVVWKRSQHVYMFRSER